MKNTKALMAAVIIMGFLIVAGLFVVITEIARRSSDVAAPSAALSTAPSAPFEIPAGARVDSLAIEGGTTALLITRQDGSREVRYFNKRTGQQTGANAITNATPTAPAVSP